ncbi:MAG: RIP metalloprotease RseP [Neisseriaceae bacterium]|jgi:regulator of sigma E protease
MAILAFLITIGILVIIHEFGHYVVARACNVKVLTFSIGFGPKLFNLKGKHNDWSISLIPLGGYIKMLDEREGEIKDEFKHLAFNRKKPWQKILIALAGPGFNILFAIIVYYILALTGIFTLKPIIMSINPLVQIGSVKQFNHDMYINKINGKSVLTWNDADKLFHLAVKKGDIVKLDVSESVLTSRNVVLNLKQERINYNQNMYLETLGLYPYSYLPIISYVEPNSPAYNAGLKVGDEIIGINNILKPDWFVVLNEIRSSVDKTIYLRIKTKSSNEQLITLKPILENNDGTLYGKIGIMPTLNQKDLDKNSLVMKYGIVDGFTYAIKSCYSIIALNLSLLVDILSGHMSAANLGGPISIAKAGELALEDGIKKFADFLAIISLGLAIMNLLPIPVLDGGHLVIYIVEWIIGKEVSHKTQMLIFKIGFILVIAISLFAIYNDILRL